MEESDIWVGDAAHPDTYRLLSMLGGGGEGAVWLAEVSLSPIVHTKVAVKIMAGPLSVQAEEEWALRGHLLRQLASPGLVHVLDVFVGPPKHRAGTVSTSAVRCGYVAMKYVEGPTLLQWIEENPHAGVSQRLALLRTPASALDELHAGAVASASIAHGDVKPSNIIIDAEGRAVLVDVGLTRLVDGRAQRGLTLPFAAPELKDATASATPATDRFAFAATVVQLLTGESPRVGVDGFPDRIGIERQLRDCPRLTGRNDLIAGILSALSPSPQERATTLSGWLNTLGQTTTSLTVARFHADKKQLRVATNQDAATVIRTSPNYSTKGSVRSVRRRRGYVAVASAAVVLVIATLALVSRHHDVGRWRMAADMASGHGSGNLVRLADGRVLAISGNQGPNVFTAAAEIYSHATGQWTSAGSLHDPRMAYGQPSLLPDGKVLVAGGQDPQVVDFATAELYNPATNQWTRTGSLHTARRNDVQVELANGRALVATGAFGPPDCNRFLTSAELYDPATGQWIDTGSTQVPREGATAIRMADGRALLAGGYTCGDSDPATTEIYNPPTGLWIRAGDLPYGRMGGAMVLLSDGRVLMVDGWRHVTMAPFADAAIFDPATGDWTQAAKPRLARSGPAATLLRDGKVLVSQGGQIQSELYDPVANTWTLDATAVNGDGGAQTILLPTGDLLLAGGYTSKGPSTSTELYRPAGT